MPRKLYDNAHAVLESVVKAKPSSCKGRLSQECDDVEHDGAGREAGSRGLVEVVELRT